MKKLFPLIAFALLVSCSKEMEQAVQVEKPAQGVGTYTLTVTADKGERPDTKALGFDESTLKATWTKGDTVRVNKGSMFLGVVLAQADGRETTLYGTITGELAVGDVLTLQSLNPDYSHQDGTIDYIASHCDYAQANVTVTEVNETTVSTTEAAFANQQAIVKFALNVSAKPLSITLPGRSITVTPESARSDLYVAIPALSSQAVSLMAAADEKVYVKTIANVTLEAGRYYTVTATLEESSSSLLVHNESELNAAVQIDNAQILFANDISVGHNVQITGNRTVTINMASHKLDRRLVARGSDGQSFYVTSGSTLNLNDGTLTGGWGGDSGGLLNAGTANLTNVIITGNTSDNRGGGICNRSGGTLTMTGGSITGNTSKDIKVQESDKVGGGGIFNAEEGTITLTGVTISGNEAALYEGGGICNYGTLNIDGCTIQNNTARTSGGGIWSGNEKHLLRMQGAVVITDNTAGSITNNLFLSNRRLITVTGSITGSRIGVTLEAIPNMFTTGFATYHSGDDFSTIFQCDRPETDSLSTVQPLPYYHDIGEVLLSNRVRAGTYPYVEHSWDSENKKVLSTTKFVTEEINFNATPTSETQYKRLYSTDENYIDLGTENSELHEYYVVDDPDGDVYIRSLTVNGPNVHIIICDGSRLHFKNDITVSENQTLYIHAQSAGSTMGRLFNDSDYNNYGGIGGGGITNVGGNIEIHGGNLNIHGGNQSAAIGGDYKERSGDITIYDGRITVVGGGCSAGIGAGLHSENYGNITIYDGWIDATGGSAANPALECGGAGIGGGSACLNGNLTIWGGTITARGDHESAGIGSAQYGGDHGAGTITINGGNIKAYGDSYGAGIGGGDGKNGGTLIVNGGRVEAYGGTDAAGIGGGEDGSGGYVTITGGYVYAEGGWEYGAGIGGGQDGAGATVTITGGVVVAKSGNLGVGGMRGIGPGSGSNDYGSLTLGDNMMVSSWNGNVGPLPADERKDYCWYHTQARVEPCTHPGYTAETCPYHKHD